MKREHINAKIMTVREFISEYLKRHIKEIKGNGYPFEAFMLMSIGIEFLGKCVNISFDPQIRNYVPTLSFEFN